MTVKQATTEKPATGKPSVVEALSRVMAAVQAVKKGDRNQEQNYSFRGVDAVVNAVGPRLREHGVLVIPELETVGYRDVQTSRGKPSRECTVKVRYRFYGPAGDYIDTVVPGESMDFGDKGAAKAMSVAFRIALLQALCIPTDDTDADAHSYERASEWDAAVPANPEQANLFDAFLARTKEAKTAADIDAIGGEVRAAEKAERISHMHYDKLARAAAHRLGEINGGTA